jgi:hypothetical protein
MGRPQQLLVLLTVVAVGWVVRQLLELTAAARLQWQGWAAQGRQQALGQQPARVGWHPD